MSRVICRNCSKQIIVLPQRMLYIHVWPLQKIETRWLLVENRLGC